MTAWWWLFKTEFTVLCRQTQSWLYPLGFFLMVIALFPIAFSPDPAFLKKYVAGCIWITALFASLLSIENFFQVDREDGHLEQLLISSTPLTVTLSAKLLSHWCVTQIPLILLTPLMGLFFQLNLLETYVLALTLLIGTPILTLIGALGVSLTLGLKQPGILLGLLILPLVAPIIIFAISAVQQAHDHLPFSASLFFLCGLCIFAITLIPMTIAMTLRVSMDN